MAGSMKAVLSVLALASLLGLAQAAGFGGPRKLGVSTVLASSADVNPDAAPASTFTTNLAACGLEIAGWEKHDNTFPIGKWEAYFADSAAGCAAACAANSDRCAAALWEDATVLPYSDDAKCQFVSELTGFTTGMPDGIALYTPCQTNCGAEVAGFEKHANTLPTGVWDAFFADSAAGCAAACAANADRCVAALWEDAKVMPYADDAKCQLVSALTGYTPDMPDGVDLYIPCQAA